ncbi:hypothetical protein ANCCAN_04133 [Ancylostoma caninum]|uniref:SCP domain-containing protein n=1 Tax=Ancylostoma caninum TaxID=29170 RepID=A0A368H344_ANCCA|nr:hypothetical protein ANCCAN_04133 [Ancylostoma caninum]
MTSLIFVACAFSLLVIASSNEDVNIGKTKPGARCNKELGDKAINNPQARKLLFTELQIAKGQWNNLMASLKYSCELEKLAGTLVTEPAGNVEGPYEVITDAGTGILNLKDVVKKWKDQLQKMGQKKFAGCNYSKDNKQYKIACVFQ